VNVLADTSLWIDHWRRTIPGFADLLDKDRIVLHPFVLGEIALGSIVPRREVLKDLRSLRTTTVAQNLEVLELVERAPLWGRGISWVDAHLLAAALIDGIDLWTLDQHLHAAARDLGVAL
jgi:predicted nucleic acid-binding protein